MPQSTSVAPPIVVDSISKTFRVPEERMHTLKERALHPLRPNRFQTFDVLKDISFHVGSGEFFGIAGRNGSGKSTLLKCMAGIYGVNSGRIWMDGRLSTFIELGVGFNQDLAARDNVVLNGIMMGLSPREARRRVDEVIDFAELREFEELKLKNYSSGMHVRLAFSVAIQVDADILLVDEVLAVGDAAFQQKCFDVFYRMRDEGRTIVFVTHDMGSLNASATAHCSWSEATWCTWASPTRSPTATWRSTSGAPSASGMRWTDAVATARLGGAGVDRGRARASARRRSPRPTGHAEGAVRVHGRRRGPGPRACTSTTKSTGGRRRHDGRSTSTAGGFGAGEEVVFSFAFENVLAPGRYSPLFTLAHRGTGST